ncbi:P27 family predicted phage terminase small subunit [Rhodoligotrophos appendicifer]|uniref:phage terminase small subunit P27 family n=1 Tax=Rhodoligotrophos appendicifer TaxID=987056 RepID=UPI001184BE30|nr:phage terminase small subunit P27 family [Rhodoligotrophos appendicifer]
MARGRKPENITSDRQAIDAVPSAPAWLSKDAKAVWRQVAPLLVERRILTQGDLGTLESYATSTGLVRDMQRAINKDGAIVATDKGPKRHPALGIQNAAMVTARLCAGELGLTPVSRSRPSIRDDDQGDDDDPLNVS